MSYLLRLALVVAVLLLSASVGAAQDWNQYQKDAGNPGFAQADVNRSWVYTTNTSITSPVVPEGKLVYFGDSDGDVYTYNQENGSLEWSSSVSQDLIYASPITDEDSVYFTDGSGAVYSFDRSGERKWRFETDNVTLSTPAVSDGTVFAADAGSVYAVSAETGESVWKTGVEDVIAFSPTVRGSVYVGTIESRRSGRGSGEGALYSIDTRDGSVNWKVSGSGVVTTPVATEEAVVYATVDGSLVSVDRRTGDELWRVSTNTSEVSSPAYSNGSVYYGVASEELHAVDSNTGEREWSFEGSGDMTVSPAVSEDTVYAAGRDGTVYSINATTGEGVWWAELGRGITNIAVTSVSGTVYAGTESGVVAVSAGSTVSTGYDGDTEGQGDGVSLPAPGEENPLVETPDEYDDGNESNVSDLPDGAGGEPETEDSEGSGPPVSYLYPLFLGIMALVAVALYGWRKGVY